MRQRRPLPCSARARGFRCRYEGKWSERADSNRRPLDPQSSALPDCATLRPARAATTRRRRRAARTIAPGSRRGQHSVRPDGTGLIRRVCFVCCLIQIALLLCCDNLTSRWRSIADYHEAEYQLVSASAARTGHHLPEPCWAPFERDVFCMTGPTSPPPSRSSPRPTGGWEHEVATANGIRNMKYRYGVGFVMIEWLWLGVVGLAALPLMHGWFWIRGTRLPDAAWALVAVLALPTAALSLAIGSLGSAIVLILVSLEFLMDCAVHGCRFALLHGVVRR